MPVKKRRLSINLEHTLYDVLKLSAKKKGVSLSRKARDLIREAMEIEEDLYWQEVAKERERTFLYNKTLIS
jgi:macrodomain Ter protein organizer (MatP/YcbG family)